MLNIHVVEPTDGHAHTHTIIFLHGRDSTAAEFASELFESEASWPSDQPRTLRDLLPTVRWVFPAAPMLKSARFDTDMSQWFDMWSTEDPDELPELQLPGLRASVAALVDVVREEERRVGKSRIFVGGISQGSVVVLAAFLVAYGAWRGLGGLIGLCGWKPLHGLVGEPQGRPYQGTDSHARSEEETSRPMPVFLGHSRDDGVISIRYGRKLRDALERFPDELAVEWHEYKDGGHWLNEPRGVDDIIAFLRENGLEKHLPV